MYNRTIVVHTGVMRSVNKTVRQSVSLPVNVAAQVRSMARTRRLSSNRMLLELIENGMEAEKRKQQEFFDLAERFRNATNPEEVKRLGDSWVSYLVASSGSLPAKMRDELVKFYDANLKGLAERGYARALETMDQEAEFKARTRDDLVGWFKKR